MQAKEFARDVWLARECFYHDLHGYHRCLDRFEELMTQLVVPTEWRAPIRVMTQGECYYGTDGWTADHVMAQAS